MSLELSSFLHDLSNNVLSKIQYATKLLKKHPSFLCSGLIYLLNVFLLAFLYLSDIFLSRKYQRYNIAIKIK